MDALNAEEIRNMDGPRDEADGVEHVRGVRWWVSLPNRNLWRGRTKHYASGTVGDEASNFAQALETAPWESADSTLLELRAVAAMLNEREDMKALLAELLAAWPEGHQPELKLLAEKFACGPEAWR